MCCSDMERGDCISQTSLITSLSKVMKSAEMQHLQKCYHTISVMWFSFDTLLMKHCALFRSSMIMWLFSINWCCFFCVCVCVCLNAVPWSNLRKISSLSTCTKPFNSFPLDFLQSVSPSETAEMAVMIQDVLWYWYWRLSDCATWSDSLFFPFFNVKTEQAFLFYF